MTKSKEQFFQERSLSQGLAATIPEYQEYAGTDPKISDSIAVLNFLIKFNLVDKNDPYVDMMKGLLNELRKARFATSDRVNEITKMGMQMPRGESKFGGRRKPND